MKVVIAGGSGWIGEALSRSLAAGGNEIVVLTRSRLTIPEYRTAPWDGTTLGAWAQEIDGADAVINLTGASLAALRWTPARKIELLRSRVQPTSILVQAIRAAANPPEVFIQGSAAGYYGDRGDEILDEESRPGIDFLSGLVIGWEAAAASVAALGVRLAVMRTAVVLGRGGEILPRMTLPFRLFLGGPLGDGKQWFPWIHLDDAVGLISFALTNPLVEGPINTVAPGSVRASSLAATLGEVLSRPSWIPAPRIALRIAVGEMADTILASQRVVPAASERLGYVFKHPNLKPALEAALS